MYKRKRYSGKSRTYSKKKRGSFIRPAQRGYVRKSGNYGRYNKGGEMKFLDDTFTDAAVSATGTIQEAGTVIVIQQGTTQSQRIGRKVVIKKILANFQIRLLSTAAMTLTTDTVRIIIYKDKQCNGATASVAGILASTEMNSYRNLTNSGRFTMLYDKKCLINATTAVIVPSTDAILTGERDLVKDVFIDCNIPIEYDSTTGAISEIRSNNIGMLFISEHGLMRVECHYRIRYTDN